jgi:hypothetical protein
LRRLISTLVTFVVALRASRSFSSTTAHEDDVLDAWLDEDEIDASGL